MTFVDHVNQIMEHSGITDDAERKLHFTSYLPTKWKATWRVLHWWGDSNFSAQFMVKNVNCAEKFESPNQCFLPIKREPMRNSLKKSILAILRLNQRGRVP
jgi:hypothetical protein